MSKKNETATATAAATAAATTKTPKAKKPASWKLTQRFVGGDGSVLAVLARTGKKHHTLCASLRGPKVAGEKVKAQTGCREQFALTPDGQGACALRHTELCAEAVQHGWVAKVKVPKVKKDRDAFKAIPDAPKAPAPTEAPAPEEKTVRTFPKHGESRRRAS